MKFPIQEFSGKLSPSRKRKPAPALVVLEEQHHRIGTAASYKAAARRFAPGQEMGDWLLAEAEFLRQECS